MKKENKIHWLSFRLTEGQKEKIKADAKAKGLSITNYLSLILLGENNKSRKLAA